MKLIQYFFKSLLPSYTAVNLIDRMLIDYLTFPIVSEVV